jgi:hypothetical protein
MLRRIIDWLSGNTRYETSLELYIRRKHPTNLAELEHYLNLFQHCKNGGDHL